jgi:hypothetical protein
MSDEEFDNLPDWSDVEDDAEYNMVEERSFCWSDTARSCSSRSLEDMPGGSYAVRQPIMSDEEFEALPDWSDVESDAEYDPPYKQSGCSSEIESLRSSRCSMENIEGAPAAVYVPTGYSGILTEEIDATTTNSMRKTSRFEAVGEHDEQYPIEFQVPHTTEV